MSTITLGIHGGNGRLGRRILALAIDDSRFALKAVVVRPGSSADGQDAGVIAGGAAVGLVAQVDRAALLTCDVVVDVSSPTASAALAQYLAKHKELKLVIGTTGWSTNEDEIITQATRQIALLRSGNFSLGLTTLLHNVRQTATRLGTHWGVHIHDSHHGAKKDAPSGTALMLARAVNAGWGHDVKPQVLAVGEALNTIPGSGEIIISVTRQNDVVGTHSVAFIGAGETVQLGHEAKSRDIFAHGALQAAHWIADKPAGLYGMDDVLG